jgi:hypothetical protein
MLYEGPRHGALFSLVSLNPEAHRIVHRPDHAYLLLEIVMDDVPLKLYGLAIGPYIQNSSRGTFATIGPGGDTAVEGTFESSIHCSFEVDPISGLK